MKRLFLLLACRFGDGIHLLLLFQEFLHPSLDDFLHHLIFVERRMALIAGFHFDRTRDGGVDFEFSAADAGDFDVFVIISVYSGFHYDN